MLHTVTTSPAKLLSGNALIPNTLRCRRCFIEHDGLVGIA